LESTVITLDEEVPRILRPGGITPEKLEKVLGKIEIDDGVLNLLREGEKAASPNEISALFAEGRSDNS
jgi:L-threonylcarbamoyladenylate synthase